MSRNPNIEFDKLQMYFREPYTIDLEDTKGSITIYQPSIRDLIRIGEIRFFTSLHFLTTNTTQNRLMLWELGKDWNEMSDFELFCLFYKEVDPECSEIFFKDINLADFGIYQKYNEEIVLYDDKKDVEINENVYFHISQYLRTMFNLHPEEQITKDNILKKWFIDKDKRHINNMKSKESKADKTESSMVSLVSAYVNHPGTKYKTSELKDIGVYEFYDAIQRLQIYESSTALMKGMYSGMISAKNIDSESYNFMRNI